MTLPRSKARSLLSIAGGDCMLGRCVDLTPW